MHALPLGIFEAEDFKVIASICCTLKSKLEGLDQGSINTSVLSELGSSPKPAAWLFTSALNWELRVDLRRQLKFPHQVMATSLRPDMVLTPAASKQVLLIELTVPWRNRIEETSEWKRAKYQELVQQCRRAGWKTRCEPVKVVYTGFTGRSLCKVYTLSGAAERKVIKSTTEAAERTSRWLWLKRSDSWASAASSQGLINPGWVTLVKVCGVKRPEIPDDLRNITEDVSPNIPGWIFNTSKGQNTSKQTQRRLDFQLKINYSDVGLIT